MEKVNKPLPSVCTYKNHQEEHKAKLSILDYYINLYMIDFFVCQSKSPEHIAFPQHLALSASCVIALEKNVTYLYSFTTLQALKKLEYCINM